MPEPHRRVAIRSWFEETECRSLRCHRRDAASGHRSSTLVVSAGSGGCRVVESATRIACSRSRRRCYGRLARAGVGGRSQLIHIDLNLRRTWAGSRHLCHSSRKCARALRSRHPRRFRAFWGHMCFWLVARHRSAQRAAASLRRLCRRRNESCALRHVLTPLWRESSERVSLTCGFLPDWVHIRKNFVRKYPHLAC